MYMQHPRARDTHGIDTIWRWSEMSGRGRVVGHTEVVAGLLRDGVSACCRCEER